MAKQPAYQWYPGDWRKDPAVRALTPESRAFWREALDCLWESETRGELTATVDGWARLTETPTAWVDGFIAENAVTKTGNVTVTDGLVTIQSRRMMKDEKVRKQARERQRKHRESRVVAEGIPVSHKLSSSSTSSSTSVTSKEVTGGSKVFGAWQEIVPTPPAWHFKRLDQLTSWLARILPDGYDPEDCMLQSITVVAQKTPPPSDPIRFLEGVIKKDVSDSGIQT